MSDNRVNFHSKDCQAEQLGAQHIFKMSRLGSATKEDIQDLHDQKDSLNTKIQLIILLRLCCEGVLQGERQQC